LQLYTMNHVKQRNCAVQHPQRPLNYSREIRVAGRIDNVDADVAPGAGRGRGRNGDAALLLLLHPVHGGSAFMHLSDTMRLARVKQYALSRSGLTSIAVGQAADVPAAL